ncbi:hypothetical protein GRX03_08820 [Halovenus sp. WSH3]|uniref:Uncharacterized protein n=1 Tax=Halovenus carboxidivorans TaxID=2692199 RepID=A0A6B0T7X0_9EURY|nr:DUF5781 family protein [Halovenus carboxidivorans]MXR51703.1 hypothetical protein [Halovenus carboxidivorans]
MDVQVEGSGPVEPFFAARDLFEREATLDDPVTVRIVEDPDERTRVKHTADGHTLTISQQAATSAMARELALHEFAHMHHHERGHPSHTQSMEEVIFLALAGRTVERRKLTHCRQIANHMKDIYADDLWLSVAPAGKLVDFLESSVASALADQPSAPAWDRFGHEAARTSAASDPEITAVNAAFALGLVERHNLVEPDHRLYDLAHAAAADAPEIDFERFKGWFRSLSADPDESEYRKTLVDATREYAGGNGPAAD